MSGAPDAPRPEGPGPLRLAFDTATPVGSVALGRGARVLAHAHLAADARHAETLLPAVDALLREAGVTPRELAAVIVGGGPGSFTGVRIAAATAKGMSRALGVPLHAHSSLLALAAAPAPSARDGAPLHDRPVCALLDARRNEVYAGCWRFPAGGPPETLLAPAVLPVVEVLERLAPMAPAWVGQGAERYAAALREAGCTPLEDGPLHPDARALLALTAADPEASRVADPGAWEPEYLRASGAERGVQG